MNSVVGTLGEIVPRSLALARDRARCPQQARLGRGSNEAQALLNVAKAVGQGRHLARRSRRVLCRRPTTLGTQLLEAERVQLAQL